MSHGDDFERDAYLRHVLRHAPDANASAPSALSDTILRQARQAAGAASQRPAGARAAMARGRAAAGQNTAGRAPVGWQGWSSLWSWLMQPAVAGSFASLVVASLVGVMWWGQPIDETWREARAPEPVVRESAVPSAPVAPAAPATSAAPSATSPISAAVPGLTTAAPPTPAPQGAAEDRLKLKEGLVRPSDARQPRPDNPLASARLIPPPNSPPPALESKKRELADTARRETAAGVAAKRSVIDDAPMARAETSSPPAPLQAAAPQGETAERDAALAAKAAAPSAAAPAQAAVAAAQSPVAPGAAAPSPVARARLAAEPLRQEARTGASQNADRSADTSTSAAGAPPAVADSAPGVSPLNSPLARARAAVSAWPEVWTWQRGSGAEQPMTSAVQAWLSQADQAAGESWQAASGGAGAGRLQTLRLLRNGRLHTTVLLEAGALRVGAARAPLPAATAAALSAALERATP